MRRLLLSRLRVLQMWWSLRGACSTALSVPPQKLLRGSALQLLDQHWGWAEQVLPCCASLPLVVENFRGRWKGWELRWSSLPSPCQGSWAGAGDTLKKTTRPGKGCRPLLISWSEVEESIVAAPCSAPGTTAVSHFVCYPAQAVKCSGLLTGFVAYLDHLT